MTDTIPSPTEARMDFMAFQIESVIPKGATETIACIADQLPVGMSAGFESEAGAGKYGTQPEDIALSAVWRRASFLGGATMEADELARKSATLYKGIINGTSVALAGRYPEYYDLGNNKPDHVVERTVRTARALAVVRLHEFHADDLREGRYPHARQGLRGANMAGLTDWRRSSITVGMHKAREVAHELARIAS